MASKKIVDREEALSLLRHAVDTHMPEVAREVMALLTPDLRDGESMPDPYAQADLLLRRLERLFDGLGTADERVLDLRAARTTHVEEVRDAAANLRQALIEVRKALKALCGRRSAEEVLAGVPRNIPRHSPQQLERVVKMVVERLVEPGRQLPAAGEGVGADGPVLARRLQPGLRRLERVRRLKLNAETRLAGAHADKDARMRAYNAAFPETAAVIASYLRLVGLSELADELQPSRQEPGLLHKQVRRRRATNAGRKRAKAVKGDT